MNNNAINGNLQAPLANHSLNWSSSMNPLPPSEPFLLSSSLAPSAIPLVTPYQLIREEIPRRERGTTSLSKAGKTHPCTWPGCSYSTRKASKMTIHMRTHTNERPFKCDFPGCDYAAVRKDCLVYHLRTHTNEKPFKCEYPDCDYAATHKGNLVKHIRTHHANTNIRDFMESDEDGVWI